MAPSRRPSYPFIWKLNIPSWMTNAYIARTKKNTTTMATQPYDMHPNCGVGFIFSWACLVRSTLRAPVVFNCNINTQLISVQGNRLTRGGVIRRYIVIVETHDVLCLCFRFQADSLHGRHKSGQHIRHSHNTVLLGLFLRRERDRNFHIITSPFSGTVSIDNALCCRFPSTRFPERVKLKIQAWGPYPIE